MTKTTTKGSKGAAKAAPKANNKAAPKSGGKSGRSNAKKSGGGLSRVPEIIGVIIVAVAIFAGYAVWLGADQSAIVQRLRTAVYGCFGALGFIAPVALLAAGIAVMFIGRRGVRWWRLMLMAVAALALCGICHSFYVDQLLPGASDINSFMRISYDYGPYGVGAGAAGAVATWHLIKYLGGVGTAVALVCLLIVIAVAMSRKSVREMYDDVAVRVSGGMQEYRERRQLRGRERAELRARNLEERIAREEDERLRREEHERVMEQERQLREEAEEKARRIKQQRAAEREIPLRRREEPEPQPERRTEPAAREQTPDVRPVQPADKPYETDDRPVTETELESMKARTRGDSDEYRRILRDHKAQEGVPMFLDKRVPGQIIGQSAEPARQDDIYVYADDEAELNFSGYDQRGSAARQQEGRSYKSGEFSEAPVRTVNPSELKPDAYAANPERTKGSLFGGTHQIEYDDDIELKPIRTGRGDRQQPATSAGRRIDTARARDGAPVYTHQPHDTVTADVYEPELKPTLASPVRERVYRDGAAPAHDSAYAASTGYDDDGMPYEIHADTRPQPAVADAVREDDDDVPPNYDYGNEMFESEQTDAMGHIEIERSDNTGSDAQSDDADDGFEPLPEIEYEYPEDEDAYKPTAETGDTVGSAPTAAAQPVTGQETYQPEATQDVVEDDAPPFDVDEAEVPNLGDQAAAQGVKRPEYGMYTPTQADVSRAGTQRIVQDRPEVIFNSSNVEQIPEERPYFYPPIDLLRFSEPSNGLSRAEQQRRDTEKAHKLEETLQSFGIQAKAVGISRGPAITRFEMTPAPGVRVSKISNLSDDIALTMAATTVRIEAPIPGKSAVGIELPNDKREMVTLRDVLDSADAAQHQSKLAVALGKDNAGKLVIADIAKMPHMLIAGATGAGKSVCINTIIMSIIYRATPDEVRLILIDPKVVELSVYNGVPHLLVPVVTDPKKASSALNWAVLEMTERYKKFADRGVRDLNGFNHALKDGEKPLPQIVVIIDELSDLMMVAPGEVEDAICRLAQLARAAGIHLVIATQRPSVNVITGVIKANIPSRIAFTVASQVDSRTILDGAGAEKLLGRGDMLYMPQGVNKPIRVQGANITDDEVAAVTEFIKKQHDAMYNPDFLEKLASEDAPESGKDDDAVDECDELLPQAVEIAVESGQISISMLQRRMRIGYARAGRIVDEMTRRGIIGEADGAKPRMILISREEFKRLYGDKIDE